ncbi:MAG TPA: hypothetical protein PKC65_16010 [Pyrinomonadaceae bacterium]|nr:hypothetical protein [Pyrinomonadaceae bacterium]
MSLFTFFLEYEGGTYITQITAKNPKLAIETWAKEFDLHNKVEFADIFEPRFQEKLVESLDLKLFFPIENVINTWTFNAYRLDRQATIHLTKTDPQS